MGGGGSSGDSTQVQKTEPWEGQKSYLTTGYEGALNAYQQTPTTPYAGPLSTPVTADQQAANQRALSSGASFSNLMPTLTGQAGSILDANVGQRLAPPPITSDFRTNPMASSAVAASLTPVLDKYQQQILPQLKSQAVQAGAFTGTDISRAKDLVGSNFIREAGDAAARAATPIYQTERQLETSRQNTTDQLNMGANVSEMNLVPNLVSQGGQAALQGSMLEQQAAQQQRAWNLEPIQEAIQRYQMALEAPWQALNPYMRIVQGFNPGGTSTTTGRTSSNDGSSNASSMIAPALGALMMGMMMFSDRRLKDDIEEIGEVGDLPLYKFRYKGSDQTQVGFMADEVEEVVPEAVGSYGGYQTVDYGRVVEGL